MYIFHTCHNAAIPIKEGECNLPFTHPIFLNYDSRMFNDGSCGSEVFYTGCDRDRVRSRSELNPWVPLSLPTDLWDIW